MSVCAKCGHENPDGTKFCEECGASVTEDVPKAGASSESAVDNNVTNKSIKKWLAIGGIAAAAVIAVVLIASLAGKGGGKSRNYTLYVKDKEIFYSDFSKSGPRQISTRLVNSSDDVSKEDLASAGVVLGEYATLSKDGKTIFFPDRISNSDSGISLYFRPVGDEKTEPAKVDSGIERYVVNSTASIVTYLKSGNLYQYTVKNGNKDKIASDVYNFYVSDDGSKLIYITDENNIYYKEAKKDKEKLESEIDWIERVSEDCSTVFYMKDRSLYKRPVNGEHEKIASDVNEVLQVYDSGEAYYLMMESSENALANYVRDDMKEADEKMEYPVEPVYPTYSSDWDIDTILRFNNAIASGTLAEFDARGNRAIEQYQRDYAAYEEARQAYRGKSKRDNLRESLKNQTMSESNYSLFFYDGKESALITDAFVKNSGNCAYDAPALVFRSYHQSAADQVKLSDITNLSDVEQMVRAALYSSSEVYVGVKNESSLIDQEEAAYFMIDSDGKTVLYLDDVDGSDGDLYKIAITNGKPQKAELYDTDVWTQRINFAANGKILYFKDYSYDDGSADLYLDKTRIDYDVRVYGTVEYNEDTNSVIYFTDWESDKSQGTLKISKNGQSVKVNDDVHGFIVTPGNDIVYLYDYSTKSYAGDLYIYRGSKSEKIDTDVTVIIPIYSYKYKGSIYGW